MGGGKGAVFPRGEGQEGNVMARIGQIWGQGYAVFVPTWNETPTLRTVRGTTRKKKKTKKQLVIGGERQPSPPGCSPGLHSSRRKSPLKGSAISKLLEFKSKRQKSRL